MAVMIMDVGIISPVVCMLMGVTYSHCHGTPISAVIVMISVIFVGVMIMGVGIVSPVCTCMFHGCDLLKSNNIPINVHGCDDHGCKDHGCGHLQSQCECACSCV